MNYLGLFLDVLMMGLLGAGIYYAVKLSRHLAAMRASHAEMERFILDFNATVGRAEAGIKGLKTAARSSGDDLEKLIERAHSMRDELHFLIDSADQIANRLTAMGTFAARVSGIGDQAQDKKQAAPAPKTEKPTSQTASPDTTATSAAERELLRVLSKLG